MSGEPSLSVAESALDLALPELDALVGPWRRLHTHGGARGMGPHVTLLYPFADTAVLDDGLLAAVAETVEPFRAFELELREPAYFRDAESILYLAPAPAGPIVELSNALARRFPEYPLYGGFHDEVVPHVTVAHGSNDLLAGIEAEVRAGLPMRIAVDEVTLHVDTPAGWRLERTFPLNRHTSG